MGEIITTLRTVKASLVCQSEKRPIEPFLPKIAGFSGAREPDRRVLVILVLN
jgi:hypothetical protein